VTEHHQDRSSQTRDTLPGLGLALGAGVGVAIGVAVAGGPGIAVGLALGASVGLVAGAAIRSQKQRGRSHRSSA